MFTSNVLEVGQENVSLHGVDPDALLVIVDYMYGKDVSINNSNVQNVFTAASLFEMLDLCDTCAEYMLGELHVTNCLNIYQFGAFHHSTLLKDSAKAFVLSQFSNIVSTNDFFQLLADDLKELLTDDDLNVENEELVLSAVLSWVKYDLALRRDHISDILRHVRFPRIPINQLHELAVKNDILSDSLFFQKYKVLTGLCERNCQSSMTERGNSREMVAMAEDLGLKATPRLGMFCKKMLVFTGGSQDQKNRALTAYDPKQRKNYYAIPLHVTFDFKFRVDFHRAVVTENNDIYMIGGIFYECHHFEDNGKALREVKCFDSFKKRWIDKEALLQGRCAHAVSVCNGLIYVMGGKEHYPAGMAMSSVEAYDPDIDQWSYMPPMPLPLCHHSAVCHEKNIYIIGGTTNNDVVSNAIFQYCTNTCIWTRITEMHSPRSELGATVLGDDIFMIGGYNGQFKIGSMEIYNIKSGRWRFGADFPEDRKSMATASFDGFIYLCGGVRTLIARQSRAARVVETKDLWKYDPTTNTWCRDAKLVQYANIHACVVAKINTKQLHESEYLSNP